MNEASASLPLALLSIALTACAGGGARKPAARADANASASVAQPSRASARLGPPSPLGLGHRRVDRPSASETPLALYR